MSIKYYRLAKDEELPEEFCVVRDVGGEPSEYTFYVPETENAKLHQQLADVTESMGRVEERCAKLRELCKAWRKFAYGLFDEFIGEPEMDDDFMELDDRMRELEVG